MSTTRPLPILEPAAQALADAHARPPFLPALGLAKGEETLKALQCHPSERPDVDEQWLALPGGPTGHVRTRIVKPPDCPEKLPVILYLHGPGWVFGSACTHDRMVRELSVGADAAVVFPEYDLSPAAQYPVAVEQIYAVAQWITVHGAGLGLDPTRLAVAGDSVGGNMVAALTLMAKQRGDVRIVQQVLLCPVTNADFDTASYHQFAEGYLLRRETMRWFWDQYTTDAGARSQITASPLLTPLDQLAGLPPALVITAEADVLRDEGEAYAAKLRAAGVPVVAVRYHGTIHGFTVLNALRDTQAARAASIQVSDTLHIALHTRPSI
ncbi:alpha/beta hydrolase [Streptomyces sp. Tue6028]|uniref:alpha/beta hydrolase n=1 Tax=Streptomyces sp. Tue6028 TaxID=2036037 RepID=UPI003EBCEF22